MALVQAAVRVAANFEANLAAISTFWAEREAPQAYANLLSELGDTVVRNLERHPGIGRKFFARTAESVEGRERVAALLECFGAVEVREYLSGDYLLLYCIVAQGVASKQALTVYLLAIKHHPQLAFDFEGFWRANRGAEG